MSQLSQPVIETTDLTKTYVMGSTRVDAVQAVSLRICAGEFVALMGASGSGKSTLMHLIGCLDRPTSGTYRLEGRDVSRLSPGEQACIRNTRIGFVFQNFNLLSRLSAVENVALPLLYRGRAKRVDERARDALRQVGLAGRSGHRPTEMSGGERQRVAIARALVTDPAIILADEPTGNLDSHTGDEVLGLLSTLHREGRTVLVVTHNARVAAYAGRTLHMRDGRIAEIGEAVANDVLV